MPRTTLSFLTPLRPDRADYLSETAASVAAAKAACAAVGWSCEWVLVSDGPGAVNVPDVVDVHIDLPQRSGTAAARNIALVAASGHWVYPLDGDDCIDAQGLAALISHVGYGIGWVASNRRTLDGEPTAHWHDRPREWRRGMLPQCWTSPFPFHPGSILVARHIALELGGWPALPSNEAIGFALALGAKSSGRFRPEVVTLERHWEGQTNRGSVYPQTKHLSLTAIAAMLNAHYTSHEITPPPGCCEPDSIARDPDT